jgi:hypothetical protein
MWSRVEDDLFVQPVPKIERLVLLVVIDTRLHQRSRVACRNSAKSTTDSLILWINCVTFLVSPFLRSSHMFRNDTDTVDSPRPIHYRNATSPLTTSVRLIYQSVSHGRDNACETVPSPSPRSSLTHTHTGASVHATEPAHRLPRRD